MPIDPVLAPLIFKAGTDFLSSFGGTKKKTGSLFGIEEFIGENPLATGAATAGLSALYRAIQPDRAAQIYGSVLDSQIETRNKLARQAYGHFTAAEREGIRTAAEPQVNQIAGTVARRGLGGSGAGAQVIAEAQQAPFTTAQQTAAATLPQYDAMLMQTAQGMMGDGSFFSDLQSIASLIGEEYNNDPEAAENNTELREAVLMLWKMFGKPMPRTPAPQPAPVTPRQYLQEGQV